MRWMYVRASDVESTQRREATLERIGDWWMAFAGKLPEIEAALRGESAWDVHGWIAEQVRGIDPRLSSRADVDPADPGAFRLVITPGKVRELRPMVRSLIAAAPQVPGWSFFEYRRPEPLEHATELVRLRTGHPLGLLTVRPSLAVGAPHRVDLIYSLRLADTDERAAREAARDTTDYLLGEEVVDKWIADIDVMAPSRDMGHAFLHPARLVNTVQNLVQTIRGMLPDRPYYEVREAMASTKFKLVARAEEDYPHQADLSFGRTVLPDFRRAVDPGHRCPFYSENFSKTGETFCFLKIDARDMSLDRRLLVRKEFENEIRRPLRESGSAGVIGGGTGLRYMYFDLAVVDLPRTVEVVRNALIPKGLPERSWLFFYDAELVEEYVALQPTAPVPPGFGSGEAKPAPPAPVDVYSRATADDASTSADEIPLWDPDSSDPLPM